MPPFELTLSPEPAIPLDPFSYKLQEIDMSEYILAGWISLEQILRREFE